MRRVFSWLTCLYPRAWRERYGEEFTALLEDVDPSPHTALDVFKGAIAMQIRTWNLARIFAISAAIVCVVFAAEYGFARVRYVSQGALKFESGHQVELDPSRDSLRDLNLDPGRLHIKPASLARDNAVARVSYEDPDPQAAQKAVEAVMTELLKNSGAQPQVLDAATPAVRAPREFSSLAVAALLPGALAVALLLLLRRRALKNA